MSKPIQTTLFYLAFISLLVFIADIALEVEPPKECFKQTIPYFKMTHRARCEE